MRGLLVAVIACGCQQDKPAPPAPTPARVRDATPADAPGELAGLVLGEEVIRIPVAKIQPARAAHPPRVWSLALGGDDPEPKVVPVDGQVARLTRVTSQSGTPVAADTQVWLVELAVDALPDPEIDRERARRFDRERAHTAERVVGREGELTWVQHPWGRDDTARLDDDAGIVLAFDPPEPAYRIGKPTTGFDIMGWEQARAVEVRFAGTAWTSVAGWALEQLRGGDYEVYGLATDLAPDRVVTDYAGSTTFAMFRIPKGS